MRLSCQWFLITLILLAAPALRLHADEAQSEVKEVALDAPNNVKIRVRMEGPYTADTSLQVVCYFKYTPERAKRMSGAPVELDKRLGGVIASLRERGEFVGEPLETLLIIPPKDAIKAKMLLLVGLGDEEGLSPKLMEGVGRVALRTAVDLGANKIAFAPLIRDQGNSKMPVGDVAIAVVRGMLLANDTDRRLQAEGLSQPFALEEWIVEAGPTFFDDTVAGVKSSISESSALIKKRSADKYAKAK